MTAVSTNPFEQLSAPWSDGWRIVHVYTQQELSDDSATAEWSLVLDDGEREHDFTLDERRYYSLAEFSKHVVMTLFDEQFQPGPDYADALARDIATVLVGDALVGVAGAEVVA